MAITQSDRKARRGSFLANATTYLDQVASQTPSVPEPAANNALSVTAAPRPSNLVVPTLDRPVDVRGEDFGAPGYEAIDTFSIPESELMDSLKATTSELLSGELPDDVVAQVEKLSAEKSISTGVFGQASEFSTANALGLTSLQMVEKGLQVGTALTEIETKSLLAEADLNARIKQGNQQMALSFSQLEEETAQWHDKFLLSMEELQLSKDGVNLAAAELVSKNQQHTQALINELIAIDAQYAVGDLQIHIDSLSEYFGTTNKAILMLTGISTGA